MKELEEEIKELDEEITMLENGQAIVKGVQAGREYWDMAIARLEEKVKNMRERPELNINAERMIVFKKKNILESLLKTVSIVGEPSSKMLTYDKVIDLGTGTKSYNSPIIPVPWGAATFQTRDKLFICGGLG